MIEIFNNSEEANIREIQKLQDKEDELESAKASEREEESALEDIIRESAEKTAMLEKSYARKAEECQKLR
jgi:hypothetical protein